MRVCNCSVSYILGEAVYITPTFDPAKHPDVNPLLYDAPIKTVKTDYSVYNSYDHVKIFKRYMKNA
jgi:hypothetical protein